MNLNDYFNPVSLERPAFQYLPEAHTFTRNIAIHTPGRPIKDLDRYNLALFGVPDDKGAFVPGSAAAPDRIRSMLYQLRKHNSNTRIYDLGNLKITENRSDSYYAIRDIVLELTERNIVTLIMGGSQDLGLGVIQALEKMSGRGNVVTVDPRVDLWNQKEQQMNSRNYLDYVLHPDVRDKFLYSNLGHQQYFVAQEQVDLLEQEQMESIRLGQIRKDLPLAEPVLRDADFVSFDMNAVRHSDAPGVTTPSPNGFFGDECCALMRYAGISEQVKVGGIFEVAPEKDLNDQTSHLAAQALWHFIEGFSNRVLERQEIQGEHTKKFIVTLNEIDQELIFLKSTVSGRWWLEIPVEDPLTKRNHFIASSYEDYQRACNNQIPDRWWRYLKRLGRT